MGWIVKEHECFLCGRQLDKPNMKNIIWDKLDHEIDPETKAIYSNGQMIHGTNIICKCGLCQTWKPMREDELNRFYTKPEIGKSPYRQIYTYTQQELINHNMTVIQFIQGGLQQLSMQKRRLHPEIKTVLLVGAADPTTVEVFKSQTPIKEIYTLEPGMPKSETNYTTLPDRQFDLIVSTNTMEHVYNPIAFLHGLYTSCHPATKLVLSVPDLLGNTANVGKDKWFSNAHIYHFDEMSFRNCLLKSGFKPVAYQNIIEEMGDKIFSMSEIGTTVEEHKLIDLTAEEIDYMQRYVIEQEKIRTLKRRIINAYTKKYQPTDFGTAN